jgi:hypothetical protein
LVELKIVGRTKTALYVEAPRDGAMAPPGNFFLFALNDGKPSIAATILMQIGAATTVDVPASAKDNAVVVDPKASSGGKMAVGSFVAMMCGIFVIFF